MHRLLLIGGGHSHLEVLRRFAQRPEPRIALTLVSPEARTAYSGMLPGTVAGHYSMDDATIPLAPLAAHANARFLLDRVESLDLVARSARLASGAQVAFDSAAIDVGAVPDMTLPGAHRHTIGSKPFAAFLRAWDCVVSTAGRGDAPSIAVVGGGAGGVELVLAMQHRLMHEAMMSTASLALVSDRLNLPPAAEKRMLARLAERGIAVHLGHAASAFDDATITLQSGASIHATHIFLATAAAAPPWLAASGLACDAQRFVRVGAHLQSVSHPYIFATGDCASQDGHPRPKAGVFAVRQGPVLASNLRRAALGMPLARYVPQRHALAIITTGDRNAIAVRGRFAIEARWVWRWKDHIDRRFIARYRLP